jgi:dipeptidyl aminopeptidase/acylaminoacyl peptidase
MLIRNPTWPIGLLTIAATGGQVPLHYALCCPGHHLLPGAVRGARLTSAPIGIPGLNPANYQRRVSLGTPSTILAQRCYYSFLKSKSYARMFDLGIVRLLAIAGLLAISTLAQSEPPPLEAYGRLPAASLVTLSPSGNRMALRQTDGEFDVVSVYDLDSGERLRGINIAEVGARELLFPNEDVLIVVAGRTMRSLWIRDSWDQSAAFALDIETGEFWKLLRSMDKLYPAQSGLGRIVGVSRGGEGVMMPAFVHDSRELPPTYGLIDVLLSGTGRGLIRDDGSQDTIDWLVDAEGKPLLREEMDNKDDIYRIWMYEDGNRRLLYEEETHTPRIALVGLMPDRSAAVVRAYSTDADEFRFFALDLASGNLSGPILEHDDRPAEDVLLDINRVVIGVEYAGFTPTYAFFDSRLTDTVGRIQEELSDTAVRLVSWNEDFSSFVFQVSGGWHSGAYLMVRAGRPNPEVIATSRPGISVEQVAPTTIVEYGARDGLTIPALVTATEVVSAAGNAPLVVLPHGGPEAYDRFEFGWLAQFLASRGYVVLQPQFRGSDGFGLELRQATMANGERRCRPTFTMASNTLSSKGSSMQSGFA